VDFHFKENLYKYWKSKQFREIKVYSDPIENNKTIIITQLDILNKIAENINLALNNKGFRDIFITASTGLGKSLLFQLPAIDLHKNGHTVIVITPLIALMKDQVDELKRKEINFATYINSEDTFLEREEKLIGIREGKYSLIYVSPEFLVRFKNLSSFFNINKDRRIGLYVIDEAHCVFAWGTGFRPDYWFLGKRLKDWRKKEECNAPIVALTATAVNSGDFDSVSEIIEMLNLQINPEVYPEDVLLSCIKRENIEINISKLEQDTSKSKKRSFVIEKIKGLKNKHKKLIIYHPFNSEAQQLSDKFKDFGIRSGYYVGKGMSKEDKENILNEFKDGKLDCIIATKAFGMGVDIKDIDCVYHYAINESLTEYTQEIGRAGRKDGIRAYALSDFHKKDLDYTIWLNKSSSLAQWQMNEILKKIFKIYKELNNYESFKSILIYPDSFFNLIKRRDKNDINVNNIETALLLLEKDIFNRFGDQILSFDIPETTEVFCFVRNEEILKLKTSTYFKCFQHLKDEANGIVFKLNLEEFWKKISKNESLGNLKYNFFKGKLLEVIKIEPRIEIKANLIKEFEKSKLELEKILKKICDLALNFGNSTFKEKEFIDIYKKEFNTKEDTIPEIILSLFTVEQSWNSPEFNIIIKDDYGKYRITVSKIKRFHDFIKANFIELFKDQQIFHEYLPINRANQLKLIFGFLELFDIVNFQVKGSENLAFKIFIKDPRKIDSLVGKYFNNELNNNELKKVETRKNEELLLIEKFCNDYKDSNQAWEFLENYFLGRYRYSSNDEIHSNLEVKNQEFYIKETLPTKINLSEDRKSSPTEYSEGDIVNHERWGNGKVIKISSDKKTMTVNFDSVGEKILDPRYAPIKKVTSENKEDVIYPGTLVELEDLETENRVTYCIAEINAPLSEIDGETTISVESPLGRELLGCKKEDVITIQLHTGKYKKYKIIEFVKM